MDAASYRSTRFGSAGRVPGDQAASPGGTSQRLAPINSVPSS
jgi:hypothetical protein